MLTMPTRAPSSTTGTCRIRSAVIVVISSSSVVSGAQVSTTAVMIAPTVLLTTVPSWCRCRTTSRSLTMPSIVVPSLLTTRAPTLCSASSANSSRTPASGRTVMTSWIALALRTSWIRIGASAVVRPRRYPRRPHAGKGRGEVLGLLGTPPPRRQVVEDPGTRRRRIRVVTHGHGAEVGQRLIVQAAVRGDRVAAPRARGAGQRGEGPPGLADDDVERGHVVGLELGFGGDVDRPLGHEHVGPEVA